MTHAHGYAHEVRLVLDPDADARAPGGAVTVALCGAWDHNGPCVWPHHSELSSNGDVATLRTVFVAEPEREQEVRRLIAAGLEVGSLTGPGGHVTGWRVDAGAAVPLAAGERRLVARLRGT